MKNKKLLYVLVPGTLLVWGSIIYKIMKAISTDEDVVFHKNEMLAAETDLIANDTFSIHPNYRDPFSGKQVRKEMIPSSANTSPKPQKVIVPVATTKWPEVVYGGIVKNQKSNKQSVFVSINGQSNIMKVGEMLNNIELTKVFKDSIEVKMGKEKKYIKK